MRWKACELFDKHQPHGRQANMAKVPGGQGQWEAANACLQFHGGFGFACEYDVGASSAKRACTRWRRSPNLIYSAYVAEAHPGPARDRSDVPPSAKAGQRDAPAGVAS